MLKEPHWRDELPALLPAPLRGCATSSHLGRGERLFCLGEQVASVFFVLAGEVKAVRYQPDGRESIMLRAAGGEFFGESALVVTHYVCDAFATRDSRLAVFPAGAFRDALAADTAFAFGFANLMAATARRQCSRYERLRLGKARDRVLHLLSCEADAQGLYRLGGPMVELAGELGLEPETLYRVLAELERDGLIARERRSLRLLEPSP